METVLELNRVSKTLKDFALQDVSFSLKKGYIMGFIGPNGAGKSTTIRCIMDLMHKDSGEIKLFGRDHLADTKALKQRIGFVYDQDVFFEELTAEKNKRVIAPFYDHWDDDAFYRYAEQFQVPLKKPLKALSKGTKMKFALAMALSHHAELILMDEPTSGLDPIFRKELLDILLDLMQDEDKAIFFSTHITTDLEQVADYIAFILNGKIVFCKEMVNLLEDYVLVKGPVNLMGEVGNLGPITMKKTSFGFEAFMERAAMKRLDPKLELTTDRPSLEDIMYHLAKAH